MDAAVSVTPGWAGYVVRAGAQAFAQVSGSWIQPRIVCNRPGSSAAVWVGLGGASRTSNALEQIGTSADCSERGLLSQSAWYQLFPAPPVELPLAVRAGDTISAKVAVNASTVTLALRNISTGADFSTERWMRAPETDSAEWIVEAPSMCFRTCAQLPLAAFDRIPFTKTSTTVGAHTGTIRDAAWASNRLTMAIRDGKTTVAPTPLSRSGSSFAFVLTPAVSRRTLDEKTPARTWTLRIGVSRWRITDRLGGGNWVDVAYRGAGRLQARGGIRTSPLEGVGRERLVQGHERAGRLHVASLGPDADGDPRRRRPLRRPEEPAAPHLGDWVRVG